MQKVILKIYIKGNKKPLCTVDVDSIDVLDDLIEKIKVDKVVRFGQIAFMSSEFRYATIIYK